jgi:2-phospho-L-lactate transferase/gluconeogenesis factor (CofD/UPF0052 family)
VETACLYGKQIPVVKNMHTVVISGGTATNHILDAFATSSSTNNTTTYILPVSDNGGSSAEILRVFGGSAIGDIRSRLVRLIPELESDTLGMRELLGHRLPADAEIASMEWHRLVQGSHELWVPIDPAIVTMARSFLVHIDMEMNKRSRLRFRLERACVGNLFLTGARMFMGGDTDGSVELLRRICRIPVSVQVHGCINTTSTYHIAAILRNGEIIRGQSQISHPAVAMEVDENCDLNNDNDNDHDHDHDHGDVHPSLRASQLHFNHGSDIDDELPSPITRVMYISPYGEEIHPRASAKTLSALQGADVVVYSIGSLWTSIVPVLLLKGVGDVLIKEAQSQSQPKSSVSRRPLKLLLLNGASDRETRGMTPMDYVGVIRDAIAYSAGAERLSLCSVVDAVAVAGTNDQYIDNGDHDLAALRREGIRVLFSGDHDGGGLFSANGVRHVLEELSRQN